MPRPDHAAATDHVLRLRDGRRLGYAVYGDPDGHPVVNCHGGMLCRRDVEPSDATARELGLCVISPDRPGVALSDRRPGHDTVEWTADVGELVDRLGVDRFAAMGWSTGGQYAAALGASLADRVTHVAIVAGSVPLDDPDAFAELNGMDRYLARTSQRAPLVARATFAAMRALARHGPSRLGDLYARSMPPADRAFALEHGAWFQETLAEALIDTRGAVDDHRAYVAPWGFAPEDVAVPVTIWQGDADDTTNPDWAVRLRDRIPQATLTTFPDEGHLIARTHDTEILAALVPSG